MPHQPEEDLKRVERAREGDLGAFRELFDKYQKRVYLISYGMVRHREDALDLVQETFLKAYKALAYFRRESNFYTWLYRIAANTCLDFLRKSKRLGYPEPLAEELGRDPETGEARGVILESAEDPRRTLAREELGRKIDRAINELSADHRAVVVLREVEKLSYEEIAQTLGVRIGTVMSRLFYARRRLQEKLKCSGG